MPGKELALSHTPEPPDLLCLPTHLMSAAPVRTRYAARSIRFLRVHRSPERSLKIYSITCDEAPIADSVVEAALACADALPTSTLPPVHVAGIEWHMLPSHGLGSLIVHRGIASNFALLDVWTDDNMLRHHVWVSSPAAPLDFQPLDAAHLAVCVWELAVLQHERAAWLRHMFRADGLMDAEAYLHDTLNIEC